MSKKLHISFILDQTGSMSSVLEPTIKGFNEYLVNLGKDKKSSKASFTLTKFNSSETKIDKFDNVSLVPKLSNDNYKPDAWTPLYDAIGQTIRALQSEVGTGTALVIIQTDGLENASKEWTQKAIFDLIDEKKKAGWTFMFLGAGLDAMAVAGPIGIPMGNTASYNANNPAVYSHSLVNATITYTNAGGRQMNTLVKDANDPNFEQ